MQLVALDDFQFPATRLGDDGRRLRSLIASIGEDALDEGKQVARAPVEHPSGAIAILDVGGMNDDIQEQPERVDQDVPLAARDLLARVIALRIDRRPPFCAALALWLSITAADGLASRPSCSRVAT